MERDISFWYERRLGCDGALDKEESDGITKHFAIDSTLARTLSIFISIYYLKSTNISLLASQDRRVAKFYERTQESVPSRIIVSLYVTPSFTKVYW